MTHDPHYCRWVPHRPAALLLTIAAVTLALGACGSGSTGTSTAGESASTPPSATSGPPTSPGDGDSGSAAVEVVRSGGIAGVRDVVRVAPDGTATLLTRDGRRRTCRPPAAAVRRLSAMDLAALGPRPSGPPVNDGFVFSVRTAHGAAVAAQQDKTGPRAELVAAAAGVIGSCLAGQPATGGGMR